MLGVVHNFISTTCGFALTQFPAMTQAKKTFCKITALDQDYYLLVERALRDDLKLALSNGSDVWHGSG